MTKLCKLLIMLSQNNKVFYICFITFDGKLQFEYLIYHFELDSYYFVELVD